MWSISVGQIYLGRPKRGRYVQSMGQQQPRPNGLVVNDRLVIPDSELVWRFGPSGGPGGQHANTANTRAELVFELAESQALSEQQRTRLIDRYGPRIRVACDDHRSQLRNREVAAERLIERIRAGLAVQRKRRPTKPSRGSKERRLKAKKARSDTKAQRRRPHAD